MKPSLELLNRRRVDASRTQTPPSPPIVKLLAFAILSTFGGNAWADAPANPELAALREQIAQLRAEQEAKIAEIRRQTDSTIRSLESSLDRLEGLPPGTSEQKALAAAQAAAVPAVAATAAPAAAPLIDPSRLKVSGDLRLRTQGDYSDNDARNRRSAQVRGRLGATYAISDLVTIGARIATGDPDDPNSTDVQLSNWDDDLQVSLDQAYVQLNFDNLKVYGGKIPQPFTRTELVWDGDVNPQGVSAVYKLPLKNGSAFRANGLFFLVDEQAAGPESTMLGAQLGYDTAALGAWKLDFSGAYYHYNLGSVAGADSGDFRYNLRLPDGSYRSDFHLADVIAGATYTGFGERWPLRIVGDYVKNLGAATNADTGYGLDFLVGKTSKVGDWRFGYGYAVAETDAVLAAFSQDNTGIGSNYRQHMLSVDYVPSPNTVISATWAHYKPYNAVDAGSNDPTDWLDRVRLAFLVNF